MGPREKHSYVLLASAYFSYPSIAYVGMFGLFKRFYYSECAPYMKANPGKVVTKYEVAGMACSAYLKALSPWNIVSAFRKAGVVPTKQECGAFRKARAMRVIPRLDTSSEVTSSMCRQAGS
ncbi:hypothetical protein DPMN_076300 [Dreissena polymorpha]|uniref:Uncharacterized protein n=1 Tax=Dreissena polymorpha TaxID=45954 RepID=A0A9D3YJV2_DREPO|nr:hypothetical protein DPMN_076300 [Dreissena polymorpha]